MGTQGSYWGVGMSCTCLESVGKTERSLCKAQVPSSREAERNHTVKGRALAFPVALSPQAGQQHLLQGSHT